MTDSCANCHNWLPYPRDAEQKGGVCRRYPPRLSSDVRTSASPVTMPDQWCGEWSKLRSELDP